MALSLQSLLDAPIIELDTIDSTNNYAMRLIDADTALPGLTIIAKEQSQGKGQRGRVWKDEPGQSLIMSIISVPNHTIDNQFLFNVCATVAIAEVLEQEYEAWDVRIKWPNDIIINDKKAGGVLIENIIRGHTWAYSIIGIGLNVLQSKMPPELPYATSLKIESRKDFDIKKIKYLLRDKILTNLYATTPHADMLNLYNQYLYRRDKYQWFDDGHNEWEAKIECVNNKGQLVVSDNNDNITLYTHGEVNWKW